MGTEFLNGRALPEIAGLAPVERLHWPAFVRAGVEVAIKREDQLDPHLGGNKIFKLYHHLQKAEAAGACRVLSFGGAYSNHLYALAAAGRLFGFEAVGVVRGERPAALSPTLADCERLGMRLVFVSRSQYRDKQAPEFLRSLEARCGSFYCIPEGGGDVLGAKGCQTWAEVAIDACPFEPTHLCAAAGTGATLSGLLAARQRLAVIGVLALKGGSAERQVFHRDILDRSRQLAGDCLPALTLAQHFHCGGYARCPDYLLDFILEFEAATGVPLDPVYTAKLLWGLTQMVKSGELPAGSRLLVFHSGGLQGRRGFAKLVQVPYSSQ